VIEYTLYLQIFQMKVTFLTHTLIKGQCQWRLI